MKTNQEPETTTAEVDAPRKLLLGKQVLRHFNVRSAVQTGDKPLSGKLRCFSSDGSIGP